MGDKSFVLREQEASPCDTALVHGRSPSSSLNKRPSCVSHQNRLPGGLWWDHELGTSSVHTCNPSTWEAETGGPQVRSQPQLKCQVRDPTKDHQEPILMRSTRGSFIQARAWAPDMHQRSGHREKPLAFREQSFYPLRRQPTPPLH